MNIAPVSTKKTRRRITGFLALCAAIIAIPSPATAAQVRSTTVVIDAGHGGFDRGGIPGQRVGEKNLTLDVAQRLRRQLESDGYRVVMTRNSDIFVPLPTRVAIANSNRRAIFVSIHFNSATRSGANGIETYYYRSDSASLAANIHRNVVAGAPGENRGIRRRGYLGLAQDQHSFGAGGMRLSDQPDGSTSCPNGFLSGKARAGNRARNSRQSRPFYSPVDFESLQGGSSGTSAV